VTIHVGEDFCSNILHSIQVTVPEDFDDLFIAPFENLALLVRGFTRISEYCDGSFILIARSKVVSSAILGS
jgi:hypothetical protein